MLVAGVLASFYAFRGFLSRMFSGASEDDPKEESGEAADGSEVIREEGGETEEDP
jgi:hypothetical protein